MNRFRSLRDFVLQIGDTLTLIVYMTSGQNAVWDLQIRECVALDSKERVSLQLQDKNGCVTKPKIISNFITTQDRKNPNMLVAYSYLKAFRFPDDMQVQIRCVVAVCRDECRKINCNNGHENIPNRNVNDTTSSDEDEEVMTTTVISNTPSSSNSSAGIFGRTVKQRGAFESHSDKSMFRRKRQVENVAAGTLPLRHVFNVISAEDIQNLRNSSVVFVDSAAPNNVCVNQAMLILLLSFLMAVVLAVSIALTLTCLRNKALRRSKLIEMYPQ